MTTVGVKVEYYTIKHRSDRVTTVKVVRTGCEGTMEYITRTTPLDWDYIKRYYRLATPEEISQFHIAHAEWHTTGKAIETQKRADLVEAEELRQYIHTAFNPYNLADLRIVASALKAAKGVG